MKKNHFLVPFLISIYFIVFCVMTYRLYARLGAFGCGDECINYAAGYFLLKGKVLYSQIFFNRQPLMAYLSAIIQVIAHPQTLYQLVLSHRLFMDVYALGMGILLIWRFGIPSILFLLLFESTKFYVYGYQFLGEAIIVYPIAYLTGLVWESFLKKNLRGIDIVLLGLFGWIGVFAREPYVPLILVLLTFIGWRNWHDGRIRWSVLLFFLFSSATIITIPLREYVEQVIYINIPAAGSAVTGTLHIPPIIYAFLYPVVIFVDGKWTYFRYIEIGLSIFLLLTSVCYIRQTRKVFPILCLFVFLGIAGVRTIVPGTMYFEAFHMLPWYGMACMMLALFISWGAHYPFGKILFGAFLLFAVGTLIYPKAFIWEKVNKQNEFDSQYAKYTQYATAIDILSTPEQTIFLDMWDDVIYWESKRNSSFAYSLFIPAETQSGRYTGARLRMFAQTPPDFYYSCPKLQTPDNSLPLTVVDQYVELLSNGDPGCLYIKKNLIPLISEMQWQKVRMLGISL